MCVYMFIISFLLFLYSHEGCIFDIIKLLKLLVYLKNISSHLVYANETVPKKKKNDFIPTVKIILKSQLEKTE